MTDKKLSRQINVKGMALGEVMKLFKGNESVTSKITELIEAIDTPDEDAPQAMVGELTSRKLKGGSEVWDTRFYVGYKNSKRVYRRVTAKTPEESQRRAWDILREQEETNAVPVSNRLKQPTVSQWLTAWLDDLLNLKLVTVNTHSSYVKHLNPYVMNPSGANAGLHRIGGIKLAQLTVFDVEALFKSMLDRGLSRRTIHHLKSVLANSFNSAIKKGILRQNIIVVADAPKVDSKEKEYLTHEELSRLLDACSDSPIGDFVTLIGLTGMRKSEARSLRWKDIDSSLGDIHVRGAMRFVSRVGMVDGATKNDWSARKIELATDNIIFYMLASRRAIRETELSMVGSKVQDTDLVFCYGDGKPWGDWYISNHYKKIIEKAGITKKVGLHSLRHTYATLNLQHDDIQNVSRTLGHSSIRTTMDIYGHVIAGSGRKASERFVEALKQANG